MRPITLRMENWLSYRGSHELDLSGVSLAVLSGQNGAGKSSIIDAIRFALYGVTRGGLDGVITAGETACTVEFIFDLGTERYRVLRKRSSKGGGSTMLSLSGAAHAPEALNVDLAPGQTWSALDGKSIAETQQKIIDLLRMDDALFCQTACANQGNASAFSQAKPTERKAVLGQILNLEDWEKRAAAGREVLRSVDTQAHAQEQRLAELRLLAGTADDRQQVLELVQAEIADLETQIGAAEALLSSAQQERESILGKQAADEMRRRSLEEAEEAAEFVAGKVIGAELRVANLLRQIEPKAKIRLGLDAAQSAQSELTDIEDQQQRVSVIEGRITSVKQRIASLQSEWRAQRNALQAEIGAEAASRANQIISLEQRTKAESVAWTKDVKALEDQIALRTQQAEPLDLVPCNSMPDLVRSCPLIANARAAKAAIPSLQEQLTALQAKDPTHAHADELETLMTADETARAEDQARLAAMPEDCPNVSDLQIEVEALTAERAGLSFDAGRLASLQATAGKQPTLQTMMTQIEQAEALLSEAQTALATLRTEKQQADERVAKHRDAVGPKQDWTTLLENAERKLKGIQYHITSLQASMSIKQRAIGALEQRLAEAKAAAETVVRLEAEIAALTKRSMLLNLLCNPRDGAFSRGGIPALLIDRAIPQLEDEANEVLETLSDGRMSVALRTQKETKAKTVAETLDIVIADEGGERAYEQYSGGERMRVDLSLRIGLSSLLAARAGARCELLILDETCAPLDAEGRDQFVECLAKVADRFATVLVVSHIPDLKDQFPYCLEVTKNGNGSRVEVIAR